MMKKHICLDVSQDSAVHKPVHQVVPSSDTPLVLVYRPVMSSPQLEPPPATLLQPAVVQQRDGHVLSNATYTIVSNLAESQVTSPQIIATSLPAQSQPNASTQHSVAHSVPHSCPPDSKPMHVIVSSTEGRKPVMDISCLTKEGVASTRTAPPLLQVANREKLQSPSRREAAKEQVEARPAGQELLLVQAPPPNGVQRLFIVGEKTDGAAQVRLSPPQQPQVVIPVAYDQQVVSMPIYRLGSHSLQPVQILTTLPPGASSITTA